MLFIARSAIIKKVLYENIARYMYFAAQRCYQHRLYGWHFLFYFLFMSHIIRRTNVLVNMF
nr:MAG TPA: hypothetical protein [Caudoviricetes sp.]